MGYILVDSPNPYTAQGTYPRRGGFKPSGTIIVHTSEGNWRSGVDGLTNLVRSRSDYGCYHRACDWQDIAQYYPWEWECWQDTETNNWAVGIAAACRTTDWGNMPADVEEGYYRNLARMAADFVVYMQAEYGVTVPLRRITGAQARARVPGFAAHGDSGVARSDPGANFDWGRFFNYTSQALTGSLSYASESITPLEDEMSAGDVAAIIDAVQKMHDVTREHIPGATLTKPVPYKDPVTGQDTGQTTSLATMAGYADFQASQTRALIQQGPSGIAAQIDAAGLAEAVRDELVKLLEGSK